MQMQILSPGAEGTVQGRDKTTIRPATGTWKQFSSSWITKLEPKKPGKLNSQETSPLPCDMLNERSRLCANTAAAPQSLRPGAGPLRRSFYPANSVPATAF